MGLGRGCRTAWEDREAADKVDPMNGVAGEAGEIKR
jgi:hypothetical protein